jgi:Resolvase, N terminal domain
VYSGAPPWILERRRFANSPRRTNLFMWSSLFVYRNKHNLQFPQNLCALGGSWFQSQMEHTEHSSSPPIRGEVNRVAEYVRMSTEHQQYSTENQGQVIRQYAERRGMKIVRTYTDARKSGLSVDGRTIWPFARRPLRRLNTAPILIRHANRQSNLALPLRDRDAFQFLAFLG